MHYALGLAATKSRATYILHARDGGREHGENVVAHGPELLGRDGVGILLAELGKFFVLVARDGALADDELDVEVATLQLEVVARAQRDHDLRERLANFVGRVAEDDLEAGDDRLLLVSERAIWSTIPDPQDFQNHRDCAVVTNEPTMDGNERLAGWVSGTHQRC